MSKNLLLLLLGVVFAGGFLYFSATSVCKVPLAYTIGVLDDRFGISEAEVRSAVGVAEQAWENATGINLFTYTDDPNAFPINFIFDERQRLTDIEENFRNRLDQTEDVSDDVREEHSRLVSEYKALEMQYEKKDKAYNVLLSAYNKKVAKWNKEGGAPPSVFEELKREQTALSKNQVALNRMVKELNTLASRINSVGEQGNRIIDVFNKSVETYNTRFGEPREFTQGDYQGDKINVYQFSDKTELQLVLAHELGHALSLNHVEGDESIMYFLMGNQKVTLDLTEYDLEEFARVCGETTRSWIERLLIRFGVNE